MYKRQGLGVAPLLRVWPTEGAFARAVLGLDVLAMMQSDVALMSIHGIAQKAKSRPLLQRAREKIESIAEALGLTPDELGDRLVPDLGLDPDGSRILDLGPRAFRVGFDEHLVPFVKDAEGARLKDLPKPARADDPARAAEAAETWKGLKKSARAIAGQQVARLEAAMVARRRWEPAPFRTYLVEHVLVGQLVRRLVFGAFVEDRVVGTFRVAEDLTYAGLEDETFTIPVGATVGIVHPLELEAEVVRAWADRLGDYRIVQPFAQLGREVARDAKAADLVALRPVDTLKLLGLERRGWRRGPVGDGGVIDGFEKEAGVLRAAITLEPGLFVGDPRIHPTQTLGGVTFGHAPDRIFIAEVVADLRAIGALG